MVENFTIRLYSPVIIYYEMYTNQKYNRVTKYYGFYGE